MECERIREWLECYAAGRLASGDAARLEAHVKTCAACGRELRWVLALKASLRALPQPAMPANLRAELLRQARAVVPRQGPRRDWADFLGAFKAPWRLAAGFGFASAFAAAAVMLVCSHFLAAGGETLSLDEALAAHGRYELTMPAASGEAIYAGLAEGETSHD